MTSAAAAREAILERIRGAGNAGDLDAASAYEQLPRRYARTGSHDPRSRLEMFEERLREYDAGVRQIRTSDLPATIAELLTARRKFKIAIAAGIPIEWLPVGFDFIEADDLPGRDLDRLDGVLSGCTLGIALTGSIVLQNAPGQGPRKLSLVPDYHLCIVFANQIVETVPEAFDRLAASATLPTTFISGPSATADIEMTRIKGVHGPRFLDVLIVT